MKKLRVLLVGANGMLAQDLLPVLGERYQVYALTKKQLDITNPKEVEAAVYGIRPDILVNCAAFTKVDECEINPTCFDVNSLGVYNIASACERINARVVHFSTDYVFDGTHVGMYPEDEMRNPINAYGKSKLFGELALEASRAKSLTIRVQWLFGQNGPNFVKTMHKLSQNNKEIKVVSDQFGRPTNTMLLSRSVAWLLKQGAEGKWHLGASNFCSWYDFAKEVLKKQPVQVIPCSSDEFPRPAKRPKNGVLDLTKSICGGVSLHSWQEHLEEYMRVLE